MGHMTHSNGVPQGNWKSLIHTYYKLKSSSTGEKYNGILKSADELGSHGTKRVNILIFF